MIDGCDLNAFPKVASKSDKEAKIKILLEPRKLEVKPTINITHEPKHQLPKRKLTGLFNSN